MQTRSWTEGADDGSKQANRGKRMGLVAPRSFQTIELRSLAKSDFSFFSTRQPATNPSANPSVPSWPIFMLFPPSPSPVVLSRLNTFGCTIRLSFPRVYCAASPGCPRLLPLLVPGAEHGLDALPPKLTCSRQVSLNSFVYRHRIHSRDTCIDAAEGDPTTRARVCRPNLSSSLAFGPYLEGHSERRLCGGTLQDSRENETETSKPLVIPVEQKLPAAER